MKVFPTNNSVSYKILKKINNLFFDKEPPSNVCAYFWLSVFYGVVGILLVLNLVVAVEFLLAMVSNYTPWIVNCYHPLFVVWGVLLVLLIGIMFLLILAVATVVILLSSLVYLCDHKNISTESVYEFQRDIDNSFIKGYENTVEQFKVVFNKVKTTPPFNKIKCPKLNFDEE